MLNAHTYPILYNLDVVAFVKETLTTTSNTNPTKALSDLTMLVREMEQLANEIKNQIVPTSKNTEHGIE